MSSKDDPGLAPHPGPESEPAEYVTFLDHWATEFPPPADPPPGEREGNERSSETRAPEFPPAALVPPPIPTSEPPGAPPPAGPAGAPTPPPPSPLRLPRRREETETLRVHLAPEQLYWVRLAAARAGAKVDESTLVAAGLALLEQRGLDWREIRSRSDLRQHLAFPPTPLRTEP